MRDKNEAILFLPRLVLDESTQGIRKQEEQQRQHRPRAGSRDGCGQAVRGMQRYKLMQWRRPRRPQQPGFEAQLCRVPVGPGHPLASILLACS